MIRSFCQKTALASITLVGLAITGSAHAQTADLIHTGQTQVYSIAGTGLATGAGLGGDTLGDVVPIINDLALTGAEPASMLLPPLLSGEAIRSSGLSLAAPVNDLTRELGSAAGISTLTDTFAITNKALLPALGGR